MTAVVPNSGSRSRQIQRSPGSWVTSWPTDVRRYCAIQVCATVSWGFAVLFVQLSNDTAIAFAVAGVPMTANIVFFLPVTDAPFLKRRATSTALLGHWLFVGAIALMLGAWLAGEFHYYEVLRDLVLAAVACLLVAVPMTTIGLVRLLGAVSGPWHSDLARGLRACFGVLGGSLVLAALVASVHVPGPGSHELTASLFVAVGLVAGGFGVCLLSLITLFRIRRACQAIAETTWVDAAGSEVVLVELRGGQSLVHDVRGVALEPSFDAERWLAGAGYTRVG